MIVYDRYNILIFESKILVISIYAKLLLKILSPLRKVRIMKNATKTPRLKVTQSYDI